MKNAIETTNLPSGWKLDKLCDHLDRIANGLTAKQEQEQPGIAVSRIETISDGTINFDRVRYVRELDEQTRNTFLLQQGDVLFSHINSDLHLGKTAVYSSNKPLLHGMNLLLLRTRKDTLDPYYLHYLLNYYRRTGKFIEIAQHAVNQSSLNQQKIKSLLVPAPCIDIQKFIVAEIEKQFSRLDEAVAALKRTKANLKRYKAAVLKAAVEGNLTEDWRKRNPDVEPAGKLLERILAERRAKWSGRGKYKEPEGPNLSDLPPLPDKWAWCAADQVSRKITDGEHISPTCRSAGVPLLSAKDVRESGVLFDEIKYVSPDDAKRFRMRCDPDRGDILVVSRGATIGRSCKVNTDQIFCLMGSVILIKTCGEIAAPYVLTALKSLSGLKRLMGASGSTAQQAIYIQDIRSLPVPLPPRDEQEQIVAEVERRLSVIDELEATVEANLTRADRLRQSILAKAFSGELITLQ